MLSENFCIDFTRGKIGYRLIPGRWQHEPLIKICGATKPIKPTIIDCTTGLGHDTMLLAQAGATVIAFEASPIVVTHLISALERAKLVPHLQEASERIQIIQADAVRYLKNQPLQAEVVYCDPMFPHPEKSAKSHGGMQWLQSIVLPPTLEEETDMLETARRVATQWVVVKRPVSAPFLATLKPNHSHAYRSCRFDVYLPERA